MDTAPLIATWDGEAFAPLSRYAKECDKAYVIGERYRVEIIEERSAKSHRAYFAMLNEAFHNLPEDIAERFLSVEHLRKAAMCATGYCNEMQIACASKAEALRTIATIKNLDTYAVCTVRDSVVFVRTAHSQSTRAMGKEKFEKSKNAVLDYCACLLGIQPRALAEVRAA